MGLAHPPIEQCLIRLLQDRPRVDYCPRCGQGLGQGELTSTGCGACRGRRAILDGVVRVGAFRGELAHLIRGLKYGGRWELAGPLGRLLAGRLRERFHALRLPMEDPGDWRVIPMPMPRWRRWYRGLDHAQLLAEFVARHLGLPIIQPLRKRGGRPQATLSRSRRGRSPMDHYRVARQGVRGFGGRVPNLDGLNVILVDDVLTTGRSMRAAGTILRRLGPARIMAAALAVTEQREYPERALIEPGNLPFGADEVDRNARGGTLADLPSRPAISRRSVLSGPFHDRSDSWGGRNLLELFEK